MQDASSIQTRPPPVYNRRSIRLKDYDYSQAGAYFVTICTRNRECRFGKISDDKMVLNDAGRMIQLVWDGIPELYPDVETDEFIVMPNHIHGIIFLVGTGPRARPASEKVKGRFHRGTPATELPDVVHRFKGLTTKRYSDGVKQSGWPRYSGRLWQRNYYEHVIRNDEELNQIREYIIYNPQKWAWDRNNPTDLAVSDRS